jgi:LmbE family N-acetylglucosaminyl deacetylase
MGRKSRSHPIIAARGSEGNRARIFERFCATTHEPVGDPVGEPTVLLVAAHPDDEVIGAGARLAHLQRSWLLQLTDGAPLDGVDARAAGFADRGSYARARHGESLKALQLVGIGPDRLYTFDLPAQTASEHMLELATRIRDLLVVLQPEIVLTHPYEGGHPDHDAAAFAVQAACALCRVQGAAPPLRVEFTSYHAGAQGMVTSRFLDDRGARILRLSAAERALKSRLLACYVTQRRVLAWFPNETEAFRPAPHYDFSTPPHQGRLWYEWFDWGMDGERWRRLAAGALEALGIPAAH